MGVKAHTGGSGSVSEAPAMDRLDTRISVHTPLFLPFLQIVEFWGVMGEKWVFHGNSGRKILRKIFLTPLRA